MRTCIHKCVFCVYIYIYIYILCICRATSVAILKTRSLLGWLGTRLAQNTPSPPIKSFPMKSP